mmetsp:Transcript_2884/g.6885  ORF Transcript_2884/g.6885 Transcript_2884/m.6885 type:complete len:456 (-) Transcript_2884:303-1670(-)
MHFSVADSGRILLQAKSKPKSMSGQRGDLDRKRQRDKQNKSINRDQTKKLLDALDSMVPSSKRKLVELNGNLRSFRTTLHLLEDLVAHLRAMPTSARAGKRRGDSGVSLEEATARVMSSQRECFMSVELPSWRIKGASAGLEKHYERSPLRMLGGQCFLHLVENESVDVLRAAGQAVMRGEAVAPFLVELRTFSREGLVCLNVIRCRVIPVHVSYLGEAVLELEAQERAEVRESWPADLAGRFCMVIRRDPATSNACAYDITQALRKLVAESRTPMSEAIKALSTDHTTQGIMERIRGSVQSLGRAFGVYMSRLTDTHLSLGVDEENNLFINFYIRLRLPQLVGGFKSNWARVFKLELNGRESELSDRGTKVYGYVVTKVGEDSLYSALLYLHSSTGICYFSRTWTCSSAGLLQSVRAFRDGSDEESPRRFYVNMVKVAEEDRSLLATLEEAEHH